MHMIEIPKHVLTISRHASSPQVTELSYTPRPVSLPANVDGDSP